MMDILTSDEHEKLVVELDADSLVYRVAAAADSAQEGLRFCERLVNNRLQAIYTDTKCTECNIYLGTETNFRIQVATLYGYKANRKDRERPKYYEDVRAYMVQECEAILVEGQEAEDAVGIAAYQYDDFDDFIVGAIDKDMRMIAGHHYNYVTQKMDFLDKNQALRNFYVQLVTGDMGDNIPGLYHHLLIDGDEERAKKLKYSKYKSKLIKDLSVLVDENSMWEHVLGIYKDWGQLDKHGIGRILEIGQLLWIRRYEQEIWVPPTLRDYSYILNDKRDIGE